MITNTGKQIISRYLIGHTDSYASYLAIGCGPKPLSTSDSFDDYSLKTSLDFETIRIPIISRTANTDENGITKITLTAELPTPERYEITEIGVYPGLTSSTLTGLDSQNLYLFNSLELWKYHTSSGISDIPSITGTIVNSNNDINLADDTFFTNADNAIFSNASNLDRIERHERPRFLNNTLFVVGNKATLTASGSNLTIGNGSNHIHIQNNFFNIDKNTGNDELRLAFSVVNKNGIGSTNIPSNVKILVQFATTDDSSAEYANFVVNLSNGTSAGQWDFENNRYVVVSKKLSDLYKSSNFSWSSVQYVKIYVCVNNNSTGAGNFFIALDALRLENLSSFNNVYGLTAYTVMKTSDSLPIIKYDNSSNFIEFKYVVDVL